VRQRERVGAREGRGSSSLPTAKNLHPQPCSPHEKTRPFSVTATVCVILRGQAARCGREEEGRGFRGAGLGFRAQSFRFGV
jgi:hypothetical protein